MHTTKNKILSLLSCKDCMFLNEHSSFYMNESLNQPYDIDKLFCSAIKQKMNKKKSIYCFEKKYRRIKTASC